MGRLKTDNLDLRHLSAWTLSGHTNIYSNLNIKQIAIEVESLDDVSFVKKNTDD